MKNLGRIVTQVPPSDEKPLNYVQATEGIYRTEGFPNYRFVTVKLLGASYVATLFIGNGTVEPINPNQWAGAKFVPTDEQIELNIVKGKA